MEAELKTNWEQFFFHPPTDEEIERRLILERKGYCEIDGEKVDRYFETELLNQQQ